MPTKPLLDYILNGLEAAPVVQARILSGSVDWDKRPDPSRFTLREMIAHLADWDEIWAMRVDRFLNEDHPMLESIDEGVIAEERGYASQDPLANLELYRSRRAALVAKLRALPLESWSRTGHREFVGDMNLFEMAALITGHDGYHLKQAIEFTG